MSQDPMTVKIENLCVTSYGGMDEEQLNILDSWMSVCLSFTDLTSENGIPKAELQEGQDALHAYADQVGTFSELGIIEHFLPFRK